MISQIEFKDAIKFIEENEWAFWVLGVVISFAGLYFPLRNWIAKLTKSNRNIYNETIKSTYSELFEFTRNIEPSENIEVNPLHLVTGDFNTEAISGFCFRVTDFKDKGNKFNRLIVRFRFNRLHKIAEKIESYQKNRKNFNMSVLVQPDDAYTEMYTANEENFKILKKRFKKFYLSIFDNL